MELRNNTEKQFVNISSEEWREYQTPFGTKRINKPLWLGVSDNGHRVLDTEGISHYIDTRQGFFVSWKAKAGEPHFVK